MAILFNECIKVTLNFRMQFESFEKEGPLGAQLVIRYGFFPKIYSDLFQTKTS